MTRSIVLVVACAAACSTTASSRAKEHPDRDAPIAVSVPLEPAGVDLTGTWATGSEGEPAVRMLEVRPQCNYSPATWILEQSGDTVRAWAMPARQSQGIAVKTAISAAPANGRVSGHVLTMGTTGARYVLQYDSTSGHLRGTLNGAPFWAVRQHIVRPEGCIPPP
jgi:hypothetical protein